jgi:hypothetical protein
MKIKLLVFLSISVLFTGCMNNSQSGVHDAIQSNSDKYVLDFENDSCKIKINHINKSDLSRCYVKEPFLRINAECISLKEFISLIKDIDKTSIVLEDKDLKTNIIVSY